jgi:RHS repeat-associated protein
VTGVQDPFGRNAWLQYNSSGVLTNIVDAIGLFSAFSYDSNGWVTNLTTPYGTTTFEHFVNTDAPTNEFNNANPYHFIRAVRIKDPSGGTNVYMLRQDSSRVYTNSTNFEYFSPPFDYYNEPSWATPDQALGFEILATYRDSFFWGPRQAASLPVDLTTISATQLYQARMRHWLHNTDSYFISQTLGMQLEPSSDGGQTMGQSVWYAYYGANGMFSGTNSIPALIGLMLPDQTPSYTWYRSDIWGHPTNIVQTYSTVFGETPFGEIPTTRTNQYIYDANGIDLVRIVGPEGETIAGYHYDANHQVTFVTNAVGDLTTFMYDSQGRLTSSRTAAGLTTTNIYFPSGAYTNWVQTAIDLEISRTNSWTYTNDLVLTHTDERGLTTTFAYDNLQRPTVASDSRGTIYYYYNKLDLSQVSDRMGLGTWFGYDAVRRLTAVTNALGYYTLYNYCSCGALDSIQDALTNVTSFYYDSAGRLTNTTYADGYVLSRQLDLLGRVIIQTDSGGISKTNWFNNQGLLYAISNAAGNVTTFTVDLEDRAINHVDGNGVTTVGTYDNLGRMLTRSYPDGGVEYLGYSAAGLAAYTNQLGFVTRYYYDAARRKTAETNANTEGIEYTYNAAGDLLTLTDGKGQVTTWHADQWGRITNKLDQSGTEILRYTYDPDNRLTNRWSVAKGNTAYSYDDMGNLTLINYPASHDVTFTYDPLNRVTNMVDGVGTTVYTYTSTGQVLSEDGPFASDTVTNGYSNRLRTGLGLQQPTGEWTNGFTLDGARRFATITSPAGTFTYHPLSGVQNLVAGISLPNLSFITNFFDGDARLTATYLENSTYSVLDSAVYGYNQGNQRTAFTNAAGTYVQYSYDNIGQLKVAASSSSTENRGYTYDPAWNLNWLTNNGSTYNFLVDTKNELTNAYSSTYGYDGNGNLISGTNSHTSFVYDDENRLIQWFWYAAGSSSCSNGALRTDFVYDGLGRLRKRTEYSIAGTIGGGGGGGAPPPGPPPPGGAGCSWGTGTETRYIYDGMRVIQERNGSNNPQVAYTRGPDLSGTLEGAGGIGGLLARSDQYSSGNPTRHNYYHADGNGNITYLVDSSQALAARYRYDPFGNTIASGGTLAVSNVYRFSSKEIHVNSGMYCYLYRFYDPNLERWLNRDPLGERGFETLRREGGGQIITDHFGFVANNPVSKFDPQGLKIWVCTVAADPPLPKGSTHTYLWDDRPGIPQGNRECGKESSSGSGTSGNSSNNTGPTNGETGDPWHGTGAKGNTECYPVDDSDGSEAAVMSCCNPAAPGPHMNDGPFLPYLNDCHNAVDDCLKAHGLNPPPHSRGDPISNHIKDIECACRP